MAVTWRGDLSCAGGWMLVTVAGRGIGTALGGVRFRYATGGNMGVRTGGRFSLEAVASLSTRLLPPLNRESRESDPVASGFMGTGASLGSSAGYFLGRPRFGLGGVVAGSGGRGIGVCNGV